MNIELKEYQCPTCFKFFGKKGDLHRHEMIHSGDKPFKCSYPLCTKAFVQRAALITHTRTHTGEKPFVCEVPFCGRRFSDPSQFSRHRKAHKLAGQDTGYIPSRRGRKPGSKPRPRTAPSWDHGTDFHDDSSASGESAPSSACLEPLHDMDMLMSFSHAAEVYAQIASQYTMFLPTPTIAEEPKPADDHKHVQAAIQAHDTHDDVPHPQPPPEIPNYQEPKHLKTLPLAGQDSDCIPTKSERKASIPQTAPPSWHQSDQLKVPSTY
ncbi:hypothetical protein SeMB42_g03765 [Synchytrium endobioticum]|uniref:C2H2-type domain-containing protein n=1 Tax=Synchytrium endobioticum TaxID=286115 RepID=A0A507D4C9_9FUNG|nr:hypothetical protein SeMB42_g03765 [Synchytrium endobioticum]